jgi:hypothetical protein
MEDSLYQRAKVHPFITGALAVGAGLGIAALLNARYAGKRDGAYQPKLNRAQTPVKKINSFDIREKMEVVGADGAHVGTVDRVEYGRIKLARKDSPDGAHHFIPTGMVESVEGGKVMLTQTAEKTRRMWTNEGRETAGRAEASGQFRQEEKDNEPILSHRQNDTLSKSRGGSM